MKIKLYLGLLIFLCIVGCNNSGCPENQNNAILQENMPHSDLYQSEMSRLVRQQPDLVLYYFEERIVKKKSSFLSLKTIGPDFCGTLHVRIKAEDDYSEKLQSTGNYTGAALRGLKLKFDSLGSPIYHSLSGILD